MQGQTRHELNLPGQKKESSPRQAIGTLEMVYEIGGDTLQRNLSRYVKEPSSQRTPRHTDLCLQILHGLRTRSEAPMPDAEEVRRQASERIATRQRSEDIPTHQLAEPSAPIQPDPFGCPPGLGGETLFNKPEDKGSLVRPSGVDGRSNPGGSDRARRQNEDGTIRAGSAARGPRLDIV